MKKHRPRQFYLVQTEVTLPPGSLAKVTSDFRAVRPDELHVKAGDNVFVAGHSATRGYLVRLCYEDFLSTGPEGWVPAHCLTGQVRTFSV